jgi:transcriptional regulator with GAF, ATPase, and Fis domain
MSDASTRARRPSTLRARLRTLIIAAGTALAVVVVLASVVLVQLVDRQRAVTETYFEAITRADGVKARAARELGLDVAQMKYLVKKHNLWSRSDS